MPKDRAKDSKRVFQNPISHVKIVDPNEKSYQATRRYAAKNRKSKLDAAGWTDDERAYLSRLEELERAETAGSGREGGWWKISSAPDKPSKFYP